MRAFIDGQDRWGVRELAVAVGQPRSSIHRLLTRLRASGYLEYDAEERKYRVGFEFMRLASAVYVRHGPKEAALPILRELTERCGESSWLALHGTGPHRIAYVAEQASRHALRHPAPIGREETLFDGACGLAVLAALPEAEQRAARLAAKVRLPADIGDQLAEVRARGFAVVRTREVEAAVSIAAVIRDARDRPVGSIAIVVPTHRFDAAREADLGALVVGAAQRVSSRLGAKLLGGASAGSWRDAASVIGELLGREVPRLEITAAPGGGAQNLEDLDRGLGSIALTTASSLADAVHGRGPFQRRHGRLRVLMNLSELHLHVIMRPGVRLKDTADLARLRVSPGEQGFSSTQALDDLLGAARPAARAARNRGRVFYLDYPEGARQFESGELDALVWLVGMPNPIVQGMEAHAPSRLAAIPDRTLQRMLEANAGYRRGIIPANLYPRWLSRDLPTLVVSTLLVCRADLADDAAREIVRAVYESREELTRMSSVYRRISPEFAFANTVAPAHPGALRYFESVR